MFPHVFTPTMVHFLMVPRILFIEAAPRYWDEPEAFKVLIDHSLLAAH